MGIEKLMMAFVTLIIGVALLGVIAAGGAEVTSRDVTLNETFDLSVYRDATNFTNINETQTVTLANGYDATDWQWNDCPVTVTLLAFPNGTALTVTNDYNVTVNGVVALVNSTLFIEDAEAPNDTLVTYQACQDDYMSSSWGRTMVNLVPGFFAIALLMVSLALFYNIARDAGIL